MCVRLDRLCLIVGLRDARPNLYEEWKLPLDEKVGYVPLGVQRFVNPLPTDQVEEILDKYPGPRRDKLIPILQEIQDCYGFLTEETIKRVGRHLRLPASKIYGIATFYNQFSFLPRGKYHIRICHGSACHVNGGIKLIRELEKLLHLKHGETTHDGLFSLEITACLGACSHSPVLEINEEFYSCNDGAGLRKVIDSVRKNTAEPS